MRIEYGDSAGAINLLEETLTCLWEGSKTGDNVEWVGSKLGEFAISWKAFAEIAKDVWYDDSWGCPLIALDLVVVGCDWWLEREQDDGAEGWNFRTTPIHTACPKSFETVGSNEGWNNIYDINPAVGPHNPAF